MDAPVIKSPNPRNLLRWYDKGHRLLPWRPEAGDSLDPYRVWLSEIMLQQTTVATVVPYYLNFLRLWPTVQDMAAATQDEVLHAWSGLGYYSRARNLKKCADVVAVEMAGEFPKTEAELLALPGIGPYTAAAIAAIAFKKRATVVDGNVERVISRVFSITEPLPTSKPRIREMAIGLTPKSRPGDYAQAIMELGATVCTPRSPQCSSCPWTKNCLGKAAGLATALPKRLKKPSKPTRQANLLFLFDAKGKVLMRQRPETGLLAQLWEFPSTEWVDKNTNMPKSELVLSELFRRVPRVQLEAIDIPVLHTFTHFHLEMKLFIGKISAKSTPREGAFLSAGQIEGKALPTLMKKVIKAVANSAFESVELSNLSDAWR